MEQNIGQNHVDSLKSALFDFHRQLAGQYEKISEECSAIKERLEEQDISLEKIQNILSGGDLDDTPSGFLDEEVEEVAKISDF